MKMHTTIAIGSVLWFIASAHCTAATFYTQFTVAGFPISNSNAAPTDPVSGTIVWTAADIHSDIQSFVSIDLTLDGHTYSVGEIGYFRTTPPTDSGIGGLASASASQIWNQYDDFSIAWDSASLTPLSFAYASSKRSGIWDVFAPGFQSFTIAPVPEPSVAALLIMASAGLIARQRRRAGGQTGSAR